MMGAAHRVFGPTAKVPLHHSYLSLEGQTLPVFHLYQGQHVKGLTSATSHNFRCTSCCCTSIYWSFAARLDKCPVVTIPGQTSKLFVFRGVVFFQVWRSIFSGKPAGIILHC